ncbi:A-kinase anchor protein 2-like isoform X2 [Polyodon spathula]|uniref:A-kinase anchor protein 2-like isoform X2 n=1 Tax=Polyodon spathula TaxID=7913 RepID=UPI001B7F1540|nr:A-kinase anchor protein 2-like isoform X2 [Polyodon spathula]
MWMAEAELHKERLQALAEKRKRQMAIEDKRRQLEDLILQLQHLKSKAMRERWLLQGAPADTAEEEEHRRRQTEEDEFKVKKLEDNIHRLEGEIGQLEREESQISAKEQILREKLRETEKSIEDLQKSFKKQDGDAVNYVYSQIPDLPELYSQTAEVASGDNRLPKKAAMYAMEVSVEKDKQTGETKILSTSAVSPECIHQRGVKVYDDGTKVVYEVRSGVGTTTMENGVHQWSSSDVDKLIHRVEQSQTIGVSERGAVSPRAPATAASGNLGQQKEQIVHKEAKLEMVHNPEKGGFGNPKNGFDEVTDAPDATSEKPVTMIFMGYHNVEDEEETKKLLGYDGTIKAEIVLIDEDDEKSLREKTVTDISTMDGNAADLVSGWPLSDTTEPSSEGKDESLAKEAPPAGPEAASPLLVIVGNESFICGPAFPQQSSLKSSSKSPEDDNKLKEKGLKSVSFLDSVNIISGSKHKMEFEAPFSESRSENHHGCFPTNGQNGLKTRHESLDSDVAKEIQYLDEVLEANCYDSAAENPFNGTSSPEPNSITVDNSGPSVYVSGESSSTNEVIVVGRKQTEATFIENQDTNQVRPNSHNLIEESYSYMLQRVSDEPTLTTIKKEAKFELRAFQEDKPSKLFDSSLEKANVRIKKIRPAEEVAELERERRELIRSQAVKKNPGIATKWWNPPQEKAVEEQLEPDQLESHKKYEERKQKKPQVVSVPPTSPKQTSAPFVPPEPMNINKEAIVTEQIDFSAARRQFLMMEPTKQPSASRRTVAPKLYSAKPFSKATQSAQMERPVSLITVTGTVSSQGQATQDNEVTTIKAEKIYYVPDDQDEDEKESPNVSPSIAGNGLKEEQVTKTWEDDRDFKCARAVMTILKEEDYDMSYPYPRSDNVSYHPEELDSGLDDLSLRSQDTTVLETLSNDFSMDNVSDSGASNETMNAFLENSMGDFSLPSTPQAMTPVDCKMEEGAKSSSEHSISPLQSTYQGALLTEEQLEYHAGILVQNVIQQAIAQQSDGRDIKTQQALEQQPCSPTKHVKEVEQQPTPEEEASKFEPHQVSSPVQENKDIKPEISVERLDLGNSFQHPLVVPSSQPTSTDDRQAFSYFSKYSEAAELRSTAEAVRMHEPEVTAGPFKVRSRKQRTLSMIEEEIRAAQEREYELKKQRQSLSTAPSPTKKSGQGLPTKTVFTGKTAPGKIEKIRPAPPAFPSAEGPLPSPLPDLGGEDSEGNQRSKNYMQTLMEDFETHKTKRREKIDETSVLDATRVTRRKSSMALRWEAGIYANQDEEE